ncbi:hypothetical protein [Nocardiopsis alkaliphila]|nr:hypothetical protein [Nocardiopsis alkaliphila]
MDGKQREALLIRFTDILDAYECPELIKRLHEGIPAAEYSKVTG